MSLSQVKAFVRFYVSAGNLHDLHSPFMFDFARQCLYDRRRYPEYKKLKNYHKDLLRQTQKLQITDYGVGSRVFLSNERSISQMSRIAGSSYRDMKRLCRMVHYFKPARILELGTSLGKATYAMSLGNPAAEIISVEGDRNLADFTKNNLKKYGCNNVAIVNQTFEDYLKDLNQTAQSFDLVYMDGHHSLQPTLKYFDLLQKHLHNDSIVIVDDIYWSEEMMQAWARLKRHPNVRQSVDVFYFGLLFFRKEQHKEDFKLRMETLNLF